jgi:hypothetical protein
MDSRDHVRDHSACTEDDQIEEDHHYHAFSPCLAASGGGWVPIWLDLEQHISPKVSLPKDYWWWPV